MAADSISSEDSAKDLVAALDLELGYWILLTAIFVCQPNYTATKSRVNQRVLGTLLGVIAASIAPYFTPTVATKLWLIIISTTCFFYFRNRKYSFSTFFITVQALTAFSLAGFNLAAPSRAASSTPSSAAASPGRR